MPLIKMTVKGQNLKQYNSVVIAEDSSDLLKMQFNFRSSDWAAVAPKTINFIGADITMPVKIAESNSCYVPKEVIKTPGFGVSVFGGDMATNVVTIPVVNNEYNGDDDPTVISVTNCEVNEDGDLIVTLSDEREINAGHVVGADGVTFIPSINEQKILSWTNDGGLENPEPIDLNPSDEWSDIDGSGETQFVWSPM
jgi:hypothetical protein